METSQEEKKEQEQENWQQQVFFLLSFSSSPGLPGSHSQKKSQTMLQKCPTIKENDVRQKQKEP